MKKKIISLLLCLAMTTSTFTIGVDAYEETGEELTAAFVETKVYKPAADAVPNEDYVPYKIMVVLREEYSGLNKFYDASDFPEIPVVEYEAISKLTEEDANDPNSGRYYHYNQISVLTYDASSELSIGEAMDRLAANPMIEKVYADVIYDPIDPIESEGYEILSAPLTQHNVSGQANAVDADSTESSVKIPNDPMIPDNYYVWEKLELPEAWNYTTGSKTVKVGVIETGAVASHPDLNANVGVGKSYVNDSSLPYVDGYNNHVTNVAGCIGAVGNNALGTVGINWDVTIVPIRCILTGDEIAKGVEYAHSEKIPILNMSIGHVGSDLLYDAIKQYRGLVVCAAGNSGEDNDVTPYHPSGYDLANIISVAATDENDELSVWEIAPSRFLSSNYGKTTVDLAAPGSRIMTTGLNGVYENFQGTSSSAPIVAGVAALLLAYNPNLTTKQLKEAILNSVDKIPGLEDKVLTGGRLNARKALEYVCKGDQKQSYKVQVKVSQPSYAVKYAETVIKYNSNESSYYGGVAGELIKNPDAVTFDKSYGTGEIRQARYLYYPSNVEDYIVDGGGVLCTLWFDSVFTNGECTFTTHRIRLMDENSVWTPEDYVYTVTTVLAGDVNNDKKIDNQDIELIMSHNVGSVTLTDEQFLAADVNCDSKLNARDVIMIMKYVEGSYNTVRG